MSINSKPQASSHMFWFFLLPCLSFVGWASVKLVKGISHKSAPSSLLSKVERIKNAKSPGDRWQNAYALSQDIQKILHSGGLSKIQSSEKDALYSELAKLLEKNSSDTRLKRYLLLTLGQMLDPLALPILERNLHDLDPEVKFFASWGFVEILSHNQSLHPGIVEQKHLKEIASWIDANDASLQKIAASFLVQQKNPSLIALVKNQLKDANHEVRWNAAVALASVKDESGTAVLAELFDLNVLRKSQIKSAKDLEQLIAAAVDATLKLGDQKLLAKALALRAALKDRSPESQAIFLGLRALPKAQFN